MSSDQLLEWPVGALWALRRSRLLIVLLLVLVWGGKASLAQPPTSIFAGAVPHTQAVGNDRAAVTLGVKFWTTTAGTVSGIRFYRGASNSGGYLAELFSAGGVLLASARAPTDTCAVPCWESVPFASPVSIAANTTYVAAYYTSNGQYADDQTTNGGLTKGVTTGPLTAPASATVGGNGVYVYSTGFPTASWHDSNYYVDVSFTPNVPAPYLTLSFNPPNPSIPANAPAGAVVATVSATWSDGTPFAGTLSFAPPYSNDQAVFALSGNSLIVNPSGPGVSAAANTVQNVTIVATQ